MPDLSFRIERAEAVPFAALPLLAFVIPVTNRTAGETIHSIVLRAQIQIEVTRRRYTAEEQQQLLDLFGEPSRWGTTLRNLLWTHASVSVPPFEGETVATLSVPCTFDFNVGATKYFHGLSSGDLPLNFLFSGTVFYGNAEHALQVAPISWVQEARFSLPIKVWRQAIDEHYPNTAWLCIRRDAFERLYQYKVRHGIPTFEGAIERMLPGAEETVKV